MKSADSNRSSLIATLIQATLLLAFSLGLYTFAKTQDIWIDEATQLSGITLKFGEMVHWLSGQDPGRFGVPGDRMPPVSYILDWAWLRLFGPSELGFRLFHASFLLGGVILLVITARRTLNLPATYLAIAILCLSPKMIATAVEIRAYPLFFATACVQTAIFARLINDRNEIDKHSLASFVLVSVIAIYTHFFALVSGCAFLLAIGVAHIRRGVLPLEIILAFVVMAVASVGILPFVFSAASNSTSGGEVVNAHGYIVYLFKLIGGSANMISRAAAVLFFGGMLALFTLSTITAMKRIIRGDPQFVDWLFLVVFAGVSATLGASLIVKNFDALKESYSVWIFAPLALFVAGGAVRPHELRYWSGMYGVTAVAVIAGAALSTCTFFAHAAEFIHGPGRFVGAVYNRLEPPKAIIYESGAAWEWSYFPLVFSYKGEVAQYRFAAGGELVRVVPGPTQPDPQQALAAVATYNDVLLVDIRLRTYKDIRQCNANICPQFIQGPIEAALIGSGRWRDVAVGRQFGFYDTQIKLFKRGN
jgi:hypothetical protein